MMVDKIDTDGVELTPIRNLTPDQAKAFIETVIDESSDNSGNAKSSPSA